MNSTATYSDNGITVIFRKSLRSEILRQHLQDTLARDGKQPDALERERFAWVAAFVQSVEGLDWTPPALGDSTKAVEASYQAFLDVVPGFAVFNGLIAVVNRLYEPLADAVQRPDAMLTAEEHADPN